LRAIAAGDLESGRTRKERARGTVVGAVLLSSGVICPDPASNEGNWTAAVGWTLTRGLAGGALYHRRSVDNDRRRDLLIIIVAQQLASSQFGPRRFCSCMSNMTGKCRVERERRAPRIGDSVLSPPRPGGGIWRQGWRT